jgi:hypothetical protein
VISLVRAPGALLALAPRFSSHEGVTQASETAPILRLVRLSRRRANREGAAANATGRNASLPVALLRGEGGHGRAGSAICPRTHPLGIETSIVVPGAFTKGTNHFAHSGRPADEARFTEYEAGPYKGFGEQVQQAFAAIVPDDADVSGVADAIVEIVDTPFGKRPFRGHYDPRRTARTWASPCSTGCAPKCCTGSACLIC